MSLFSMLKGMDTSAFLMPIKNKLKKEGIVFTAVTMDERGDFHTRGFKEKMYVISQPMLDAISNESLKQAILKLNTPTNTEKTDGNK